MNLRQRVVATTVLAALLPLALVAWGLRQELHARLEDDLAAQATTLLDTAGERWTNQEARLTYSLDVLAGHLQQDNRFRESLDRLGPGVGPSSGPPGPARDHDPDQDPDPANDRDHVLDHVLDRYGVDLAASLMRLSGLDVLQITDDAGRVLSSGHYRESYGRIDEVAAALAAIPERDTSILARVRRPSDLFLAQVQARSLRIGARRLVLVAGLRAQPDAGAPPSAEIRLRWRDPAATSAPIDAPGQVWGRATLPMLVPAAEGSEIVETTLEAVSAPEVTVAGRTRRWDQWILGALAIAALLVFVSARGVAHRISRPLADLAEDVARFDLQRRTLRAAGAEELATRNDEIGDLGRAFVRMRERLRQSAEELREADRRLALGDIARQVNHDLKNGFMPLRNVFRHLSQLGESDPAEFARVFRERRKTLEASLEYLEELATNYARLSLPERREVVELHVLIREVAEGMSTGRVVVDTHLEATTASLRADPVALRRIVENLVRNARDSYGESAGRVTVATTDVTGGPGRGMTLRVIDRGRGMAAEERDRMFEHFFTTKAAGSGLGLGIVQRLVGDLEGRIDVISAPGEGTTVQVTFPSEGGSA